MRDCTQLVPGQAVGSGGSEQPAEPSAAGDLELPYTDLDCVRMVHRRCVCIQDQVCVCT